MKLSIIRFKDGAAEVRFIRDGSRVPVRRVSLSSYQLSLNSGHWTISRQGYGFEVHGHAGAGWAVRCTPLKWSRWGGWECEVLGEYGGPQEARKITFVSLRAAVIRTASGRIESVLRTQRAGDLHCTIRAAGPLPRDILVALCLIPALNQNYDVGP